MKPEKTSKINKIWSFARTLPPEILLTTACVAGACLVAYAVIDNALTDRMHAVVYTYELGKCRADDDFNEEFVNKGTLVE